jgi:hypothetical protein
MLFVREASMANFIKKIFKKIYIFISSPLRDWG